ncbi:FMN-binding negative transcriptional regulator [Schlegelella sp. S2-27]|uniref:FMN-binding negative transcriptional regulator n=1 Tax=Caldimonas mangrovi TaxID=2944811 RepID=A0ABT0YV75_9BURK|nr:FMN-binding negative transcriptional regulator [Caldimonas mangrovi]MCM5682659.1 FMN-binding negative transcriptional regulator [Caldimonas mangrovi]
MYTPKHFEEHDPGVLHGLIRAYPLGTWVTSAGGELLVNHVPFLLHAERGEHGTLVAHVPRANPVWQSFSREQPSAVVFQGPQAYVSPSWYPSKHANGKAVPTWNYAVVHAHGMPRVIDDPLWLLAHVSELSDTHEAGHAVPWKVSDAPTDFIEKLLAVLVGIEIPIARLEGKWKVSQNRPRHDKLGILAGLQARGGEDSRAMGELVGRFVGPA